MSAGPLDPFNHAVSFTIECDDQAEIDRLWDALSAGGTVELSTSTLPGIVPAITPSGPAYTASTAAPSDSIEIVTSLTAATSATGVANQTVRQRAQRTERPPAPSEAAPT